MSPASLALVDRRNMPNQIAQAYGVWNCRKSAEREHAPPQASSFDGEIIAIINDKETPIQAEININCPETTTILLYFLAYISWQSIQNSKNPRYIHALSHPHITNGPKYQAAGYVLLNVTIFRLCILRFHTNFKFAHPRFAEQTNSKVCFLFRY